MNYHAIIIGGGAAGLFCALTAGHRGRRVLVIERNAEAGRKILISGGGRCNFTNIHTTAENFLSENPHFCKSALSRFTPQDFIDLVKKHKIAYFEKKLGQLFCRDSSRLIVEMLLAECRRARVEVRTRCTVTEITKSDIFRVETDQGVFESTQLVIAAGGLSFPKIGATDFGYRTARKFMLKVTETRPSLVAMVIEGESYKELAGVSVDAAVTTRGRSFRENILFTHTGISGPAILQISNYWQRDEPVSIDLMPDEDAADLLAKARSSRQTPANYLSQFLPQRFARGFAERNFPNRPLAVLDEKEIQEIGRAINNWNVQFRKTEGYDRAEVTLGGVSTDELSSQSMGSKRVPGLYLIGEVVDVTGWLGGYNFQWAWASGHAAGNAI